jgi:DNA helicase II / ATP-dependent DNA helicase PcrA
VSVELVRDYRSTPQVVAAANCLMATAGLALEGQQPPGPTPRVTAYPDEQAETAGVVASVARLIASGIPGSEIAVLHRFNVQSPALRAALNDAGISTAIRDDDGFYDRPEIRDALVQLTRYGASQPDSAALSTLAQVLTAAGHDPHNPPPGAGAARERWEAREALVAMCNVMPADKLGSVAELAAELAARTAAEHVPTGAAAVTVTTIHKAKGLEWEAVLLPRMTDGSLPSGFATTLAEIAEERRLCYVAITRARRILNCPGRAPGENGTGAATPARTCRPSNDPLAPRPADPPVRAAAPRSPSTLPGKQFARRPPNANRRRSVSPTVSPIRSTASAESSACSPPKTDRSQESTSATAPSGN